MYAWLTAGARLGLDPPAEQRIFALLLQQERRECAKGQEGRGVRGVRRKEGQEGGRPTAGTPPRVAAAAAEGGIEQRGGEAGQGAEAAGAAPPAAEGGE